MRFWSTHALDPHRGPPQVRERVRYEALAGALRVARGHDDQRPVDLPSVPEATAEVCLERARVAPAQPRGEVDGALRLPLDLLLAEALDVDLGRGDRGGRGDYERAGDRERGQAYAAPARARRRRGGARHREPDSAPAVIPQFSAEWTTPTV